MKKNALICCGVSFCFFVLFACQVSAAPVKPVPTSPLIKSPALEPASQPTAATLQPSSKIIQKAPPVLAPDLAVTNIVVRPDCAVTWTIKNLGPGEVKDAAFVPGSGIRIVAHSSTEGDIAGPSLASIDPAKTLKRPGGEISYVSAHPLSAESQKYRVILQNVNVSGDVNISNNSLIKTLQCQTASIRQPATSSALTAVPLPVMLDSLDWQCDQWNHCKAFAQVKLGLAEKSERDVVIAGHLKYPNGSISPNQSTFVTLAPNTPYQYQRSIPGIAEPLPDNTVLVVKVKSQVNGAYNNVLAERQLPVN